MYKKINIMVLVVLVMIVLVGCSTTQYTRVYPVTATGTFPAGGTYKVLGRVDYVMNQGNAGYIAFLEHAKSVYPTTDDVVNIMVDTAETFEQTNSFMFMPTSNNLVRSIYTMSGIAIEFIK